MESSLEEGCGVERRQLVLTVRRPPGEAFVYRFDTDEVTIGRGEQATVRLPDAAVSSVHLRLRRTDEGYVAIDPGSTHGTRIGGERIPVGTPRPLADADALQIGPYLVEVFFDEGGGLTTDRRDTERLAVALADDLAIEAGSGWSVWVLRGGAAGQVQPLAISAPLWIGATPPTGGLALRDPGVSPRHAQLEIDTGGQAWLQATAPVTLRGQATTGRRPLSPGDLLTVGEALLQLRGPEPAPLTRRDLPWTPVEWAALLLACLGGGAALALALWALS